MKYPIGRIALVLTAIALSAPAHATTISSAPLVADTGAGEVLVCSLSNIGTTTFNAVSPATSIQIQLFDATGADVTSTNECTATLGPGQTCAATTSSASARCTITFAGGKAKARAALQRQNGLFGPSVSTLATTPVQ